MSTPEAAFAHFSARLEFETDCADVAADLASGALPYTVVDVRSPKAYAFGHVPGAVNAPSPAIDAGVAAALPAGPLVVYCWGPGCNGAHKAAAKLASHGRQVKEMIGGFEYWAREGQPIEGRRADSLAERADPALVG
ncbi:MAG TPA: rhodanese-like domain-containing protein [Solirubrobacteraceae bacterium]|jgi:rhodanese-related sulfurtransferase